MRWRAKFVIAIALVSASTAELRAADIHDACVPHARCAGNAMLVGACFEFRGELKLWNGNPTYRISRVGTKRILGVLCDEDPIIPSNLKTWLDDPANAQWDRDFRGDYEVCPFTASRLGVMQFVCVEKVTHLTIYDRMRKRLVKENERPASTASPSK